MSALVSRFRMLRDRLMAYRDDFERPRTLARVEKIERVMAHHFNGPHPYIMRGIAHYRGQCSIRTRESLWLLECVSFGLLLLAPFVFLAGAFQRRPAPSNAQAYFALLGPVDPHVAKLFKVPHELDAIPTDKQFVPRQWKLTFADLQIFITLALCLIQTRCPFPLQYLWKALKDMALIRGYLAHYPNARHALIAGEYSCSISLLALQYKQAGVPLYNVMHGDNASTPMESFFKIDRFYAWDAHYIELFRDQRIDADFRISANPDFQLEPNEALADSGIGVVIPMMNFLPQQFENFEHLLSAFTAGLKSGLKDNTVPVSLRPHPAYMHTYAGMGLSYPMSDPRVDTAHAFILKHRIIVGFYSTVLVEAAHLGATVIVLKNQGSVARRDYHGIFKMPNVRHIELNALPATLATFITPFEKAGRHVA